MGAGKVVPPSVLLPPLGQGPGQTWGEETPISSDPRPDSDPSGPRVHFSYLIFELRLSRTGFDGLLVCFCFCLVFLFSWLGGGALAFFNLIAIFQRLPRPLLLEGGHGLLV